MIYTQTIHTYIHTYLHSCRWWKRVLTGKMFLPMITVLDNSVAVSCVHVCMVRCDEYGKYDICGMYVCVCVYVCMCVYVYTKYAYKVLIGIIHHPTTRRLHTHTHTHTHTHAHTQRTRQQSSHQHYLSCKRTPSTHKQIHTQTHTHTERANTGLISLIHHADTRGLRTFTSLSPSVIV